MKKEESFENKQLKMKKEKFLNAVIRASDALGVKSPKVKFWEGRCPHDSGNELAHIHFENRLICVSEVRLKRMNNEEIEETATHEVTHLINQTHDINFKNLHVDVKRDSWRPPMGTSIVGRKIKPKKKRKNKELKQKIDKKHCNYHLCKKKTKLFRCMCCGKFFCKKHWKPKPPNIPNFKYENINERLLMEEYHKPDGHPCFPYLTAWIIERKRKDAEYDEALDTLIKSKPIEEYENTQEKCEKGKLESYFKIPETEEDKKNYERKVNYEMPHTKKKKNLTPLIAVGAIILVIVIISFIINTPTREVITKTTQDQQVQVTEKNANVRLLEIKMHDRVNEEREKYDYNPLSWDDRLAAIARAHSQDMATNNYFAHEDKKGNDYLDRYAQAGYTCIIEVSGYQYNGEENIYLGNIVNQTEDQLVNKTVEWLMYSKRYRNNIVNIYFKNEGIGIVIKDDKVYITENFC